ncbi:hypothetical protein [Sphingomonas faeni]|uniref:hypothetical protein n=1 Tax=Sphingomonas faeni TaxID=185950 RepID=UPI0033469A59
MTTVGDFEMQIARTDRRPVSDALRIAVYGVFGELGSLMSEFKKKAREGASYTSLHQTLVEEGGDLLWYFGALAKSLGRPYSELLTAALGIEIVADTRIQYIEEAVRSISFPVGGRDPWLHAGEFAGTLAAHASAETDVSELFAIAAMGLKAALVAFVASGIGLEGAITANITKSLSRFPVSQVPLPLYDDRPLANGKTIPKDERIPRVLPFEFSETAVGSRTMVVQKVFTIKIGDPLTDNITDADDYRFHDVFHLAYASVLGWSPVLRSLLKVKRKSFPEFDENQDGARAILIEEGVSTFVFNQAKHHLFEHHTGVDYKLLAMIKEFVRGYEVEDQPFWAWEKAILRGFAAFRFLKRERKGLITMDLKNRDITFEDRA